MNFCLIFSAALISALSLTSSYAETMRFAVVCDGRGETLAPACADPAGVLSPVLKTVFQDIINKHQEKKINLMLFPGDMISGYFPKDMESTAQCNRKSLEAWKETAAPLIEAGIDVKVTVGNHETAELPTGSDIRCGNSRPIVNAKANIEVFRELMADMLVPNSGPESDFGLTYAFDLGQCRFIILNAYGPLRSNAFSEETIQWAIKELDAAEKAGKVIFVASHPPAFPGGGHMWDSLPWYDPDYSCDGYDPRFGVDRRRERDRFWNILKQRRVTAYFCGHEHNIQVQEVEGVWHVVSGGLTGKVYPLNGSEKDKKKNTILYDGNLQNNRASIRWPWDENREAYWGWCLGGCRTLNSAKL